MTCTHPQGPRWRSLTSSSKTCRQKNIYCQEPVHSTSLGTFQMRAFAPQQFKIENIFSSGAVIVQRFSEEGPTYTTIANRSLTLHEVKSIGQPRQIQDPKTFNDLKFEWMEKTSDWSTPIGIDELKQKESFYYNGSMGLLCISHKRNCKGYKGKSKKTC